MHNSNFDPNNIASLPDPGFETRDHLSNLAVAIVSARYDLSTCSYDEIIHNYDHIIRELHDAYMRMSPPETLEP